MDKLRECIDYLLWVIQGRPIPAPGNVKRIILRQYARDYELKYFVETGTFHGDTTAAMVPYFSELHSIELSKELFHKAKNRFQNTKTVNIWHGDSGKIIEKIMPNFKKPALFWLDAHGSGGVTAQGKEWSPVIQELGLIVKSKKLKHVILIDDARGFTGHLSPTIDQIEDVVRKSHRSYEFNVKEDIVRIILK